MKVRYNLFERIQELTKLIKTKEGYQKMIQTGNLSVHDYGKGYIDLLIYYHLDMKGKHCIRLWFGTIDDSSFGGWKIMKTEQAAIKLINKVSNEVFKEMMIFPSDDKLNVMLRSYGLYVCYE